MKKILAWLASLGMACAACAQSYPSHPVRFVVPFPPGSLPDQIARVIGPQLQDSLGQPFVIENRPGAIGVIGTAGSAGSQVSIAKLKAGGGFAAVDVPYKGVPLAVTDVLGGQISFTFADFAVGLAQIKGGKLKALGVTSAQRTPLAPDIPAIGEEIPGYEVVLWYGLVAPAGTPRAAIGRIYDAVTANMDKTDFRARFAAFGVDPAPLGPDQFGAYIKSEIAKWSRDIRQAGIQPE